MPQGGIDRGETPLRGGAARAREEVGTPAPLLAESRQWLAYDRREALGAGATGTAVSRRDQRWFALPLHR